MSTSAIPFETLMEKARAMLPMHALLLCTDAQFLGTTRGVLNQFSVTPKIVARVEEAVGLIRDHEFDTIVVDWREIDNLGDFFSALRRSKLNRECVLVAIVRDLLDLRQAFAAGVHFLIHKPPSTVQIERCLRAAYCATVARRRKQHREAVEILASAATHAQPYAEVIVTNLSEGGAGLRLRAASDDFHGARLSAGEEVDLRFDLPGTAQTVHASARVVWSTPITAGVRFTFLPEADRAGLESWLTTCVERSLADLRRRLQAASA